MQANQLENIITLFKQTGFKSAKILASVIFAMIIISNVNLYQLALHLNKHGNKHDSKERAIRRMLDRPICCMLYAKFINVLLKFSSTPVELCIDRTNWKLGKISINLLILSFNWNYVAIPLYWVFLDNKGGNSNTTERISLINWFIAQYGTINILNLYADREFPSAEFLKYLLNNKVNFILRIKDNILVGDAVKNHYTQKTLKRLFKDLANGSYKSESKIRKLIDNRLFVSAKRNTKGELIVLVSNQFHKNPFELYTHRWNIEVMFNKFKTCGFNMENTHITNNRRIVALFTVISLTYVYSCYIGTLRNHIKPIKQKLIKNTATKSVSIFRYGLDFIKHIIAISTFNGIKLLKELLSILLGNPIKQSASIYILMLNF
jgi:hypothetical protein